MCPDAVITVFRQVKVKPAVDPYAARTSRAVAA
jgi:hypothetical protein